MTDKERSLISGCLRQDKAAWDAFVLQYSALVYHTIKRTLTLHHVQFQSELVEDLYQDFFLSILRDGCKKLNQFRGDQGCSLASWLRVIAARLAIDFLRRQRPSGSDAEGIVGDGYDPAQSLLGREQEKLLNDAIQSISARERILIDLFYRQGLPAEEVAGVLKTSVGAVYTQKSRLLEKLREILGKAASL